MKVVFLYTGEENLGVEYVAAMLKGAGHEVDLLYDPMLFDDFMLAYPRLAKVFDKRQQLMERIEAAHADVFAFSVTSNFYPWAQGMAKEVKRRTKAITVFGGAHPTLAPERVIKDPHVDYIIRGEGEYPMVELLDALSQGGDLERIPNLVFRQGDRVVDTGIRPSFQDLDQLPFPDKEIFYRELPYHWVEYTCITGRGCPNRCTFCCNSAFKKLYGGNKSYLRRRSVQNVIEELKGANKRYNPEWILFHDELFTYDLAWLEEFAQVYPREVGKPYLCWIHPNTIDETKARLLKDSGCGVAVLGIESIDQTSRKDILHRSGSDERINRALRLLERYDIPLRVDFILGLPGQTQNEVSRIIDYCLDHGIDRPFLNWLKFYPGTEIIDIAKSMGLLSDQQVEKIYECQEAESHQKGGDRFDPDMARIHVLILAMRFLPPDLVRWLAREQRYRFLPASQSIIPLTLMVDTIQRARRWFKDREEVMFSVLVWPHYKHFVSKSIKEWVGLGN